MTALSVVSLAGNASTLQYSAMYAFGDSFSDTGNLVGSLGRLPLDELISYWPPFAVPGYTNGFYNGHPGNGPVAIEYLAASLGLGSKLSNYAYTGALSGRGNVLSFVNTVVGPTGIRDQIDTFLARNGNADPGALYSIWGGHNDFWGLAQALPPGLGDDARRNMFVDAGRNAAQNIIDDVIALLANGARNILVVNSVSVELEPFWGDFDAQDPTLRSLIRDGVDAMNSELAVLLPAINLGIGDANIASFDAQTWYDEIIAALVSGQSVGGLTNGTDACFAFDGTRYAACEDPDSYFFWDDIHLTKRTYSLIAAEFLNRLTVSREIPEPSLVSTFALAILAASLRRMRGKRTIALRGQFA